MEDQPLPSPPHHALQLCLKALARSGAGGGTPKTRDGVSDGEREREGESGWAGELGLGIAAGAGASKLHLSMWGWTCRGALGLWILGAVTARFFSSCSVHGWLWFWHTVPVSASPQTCGLGMMVPCGTGVCSQGPRAGRAFSLAASPGSLSNDDGAEVRLLCGPLLSLQGS